MAVLVTTLYSIYFSFTGKTLEGNGIAGKCLKKKLDTLGMKIREEVSLTLGME